MKYVQNLKLRIDVANTVIMASPVAMDSGFPNGDLPTLMDDVRCTGSESRLIDCSHKTRDRSNCDNTENVGLVCGGVLNQIAMM